jgi:hypothetical protein
LSRTNASESFAGKGLAETYPQKLEKMIERAVCHAKALLPFAGEGGLGGMSWILSVTGEVEKPLLEINLVCLRNNINAVFCNRFSILFYHENNPVKHSSHNQGTVKGYVSKLDSS